MTNRQTEELAKLFLDLGKLTIASLVLGFFQGKLEPRFVFAYGIVGLIFSAAFIRMGLTLLKGVR